MYLKRDEDFIKYWNRRVKKYSKETTKDWILVTVVWVVSCIVFYNILR